MTRDQMQRRLVRQTTTGSDRRSRTVRFLLTSMRVALSAFAIQLISAAAFSQHPPRCTDGPRVSDRAASPLLLPYHSGDGPNRVLIVLLANEHGRGRTYGNLPDMVVGHDRMSVADFLESVSYGQVQIGGVDVYGIYPTYYDTLSNPYDGDAVVAQAMSLLDGDGVVPDWHRYLFIIVIVDDVYDPNGGADGDGDGVPDHPNGGLPSDVTVSDGIGHLTIPCVVVAGFLTDSPRAFVDAVGHEHGHTSALGFTHSGSLDCTFADADYFQCTTASSTGDRTDIMGDGGYLPGDLPRPYGAIMKYRAGWLPAANVGRGRGVYQLFPLERDLGSGFTQLVTIDLDEAPPFEGGGASSGVLSVEYRDGTGYDDGLPVGVYVKLTGASQTWCLVREPLQPGGTFVDSHNRISIEVLALFDDHVSIAVDEF